MQYWLLKTEPGDFSWDELVRCGEAGEPWDGVRNHQAANFLRAMNVGDRAYIYHSGKAREIVGIARVICSHFPDPTGTSGRFVAVQVQAVRALPHAVSLGAIKANPVFDDFLLVRHSRLSVMPVSVREWHEIERISQG